MCPRQLTLFENLFQPGDRPGDAPVTVARVVFGNGPEGEFDYVVPPTLGDLVTPGKRLSVPLGKANRLQTAYCVAVQREVRAERNLKEIHAVLDDRALLSPTMLEVTRWIAAKYLCSWGQVLETVVPKCVRQRVGLQTVRRYRLSEAFLQNPDLTRLTAKQQRVVESLTRANRSLTMDEISQETGCSAGVVATLVRRGVLQKEIVRVRSVNPDAETVLRMEPLVLNTHQEQSLQAILDAFRSRLHRTILIHGVTGSGKTEVYIQAIENVVEVGRQAIVLVPEISLTPQTVERFRSRFNRVAVLHSHLTDAERAAQWDWIASGEVPVVVGARSAVFAPTPSLGLIIIDEEHETSFKQESAPRYHAREVALCRAQLEGIPLILGSATPSLESWYRATKGEFLLIELPHRIGELPLPQVKTVDLRQPQWRTETRGIITRQLHAAIEQTLQAGGQVILLLNRRGFATHIQCPACGVVVRCPHCDISLTHHRAAGRAICHYCDFEQEVPRTCPNCDSPRIRFSGVGTERLEAEVHARFPQATCLRMDADSMRSRLAYGKAFAQFREGKIQILLGTQIIAKGLDFPNVKLVGVVNADTALHFPDFRAAERTFQLVTQVAGRTGRGPEGGEVIVQTFSPEHPAIQAAIRHDYQAFAEQELPVRKGFGYPPFTALTRILVTADRESAAAEGAKDMAAAIRRFASSRPESATLRVMGPAPAPFVKLRGKFRYHVQAASPDASYLLDVVRQARNALGQAKDVSFVIDVDPLDML